MNCFHNEKYVWVLPERTGSRAMGQILNFWDGQRFMNDKFGPIAKHKNLQGEFTQNYSHEWNKLDPSIMDYTFCVTVRNPYSRMLSYYKSLWLKLDCGSSPDDERCKYTFKQFIEIGLIEGRYIWQLNFENLFDLVPVKYVIHLENMANELISVPMIREKYDTSDEFRDEWTRVIINNIFTKESSDNSTKLTEEDAELVYKCFERQFKLFGYSEDSWRYL